MRSAALTIGIACGLTLALAPPGTAAEGSNAEIELLLKAVGTSGCLFIRNGEQHTPSEAEAHLRLKYGRAGRRIRTAEKFIEHLASGSSWTGKPYLIQCGDSAAVPSREWLSTALARQRSSSGTD
jgi:hypothetical protein